MQLSSISKSIASGEDELFQKVTQEHKVLNLAQRRLVNLVLCLYLLWRWRFQLRQKKHRQCEERAPIWEHLVLFAQRPGHWLCGGNQGRREKSRAAGLSERAVKVLQKSPEPGNPENTFHSKSCREDTDFSKIIFGSSAKYSPCKSWHKRFLNSFTE